MFTQKSFEIFSIDGLEARMAEIRSEIQPVFSEIGHISQHRRSTAIAPENTW